jgi:hypothetical protein
VVALMLSLALECAGTVASAPRCFGAAARDPANQPCENPRLRRSVAPTPEQALLSPGSPCNRLASDGLAVPCQFGAGPVNARARFALLGDSHADHWRTALAAVARQHGLRGFSLTRSGCPFSAAMRALPEPSESQCVQWRRDVVHWLTAHPTVTTVYLAALTRNAGEYPPGTDDPFAAKVAGYVAEWKDLPPSVTRVIVIRDTPEVSIKTFDCIDRAIAHKRPVGRQCAVARATALHDDPAVPAATQMGAPRFQVVDLTEFFCDSRLCYPAVGGVLVFKDETHMTPQFAKTLGPYLLRAVEQLSP